MGLEQKVRGDRGVHFVRSKTGESGLRMLADIRVRPAVKTSLCDMGEIIRRQSIAEAIALLHQGVKFAGVRMEGERGGVTHARGKCRLLGAIGGEALNGRLWHRLDADIPGRPDPDKQRAGFWVDDQRPVLVTLDKT